MSELSFFPLTTNNSSSITTTGRKRSNSIIPIEFRNDTSDGGMERAALATVFGVKEYTESKIFWNTEEDCLQQQQQQQSVVEDTTTTSSYKQVLQRNSSKKSCYTNQRHVSPTNNNKVLPVIPVVSEFGDIWSEVSQQEQQPKLTTTECILISPPKDLSDCSLTLFDLIQSDENPNFILWGTVTNNNNTVPPTAPYSSQQQQQQQQQEIVYNEEKKKSRWSAAIPKIIKKKKSFHSSSASLSSMTSHIEENNRVIEAATIEKLVEKLTVSLDYTFMTDFFLIFRVFMTPLQLCKYLILRFKWSIENNDEKRCIVRIRTFVVMRHWLLNYFLHDFIPSRELRIVLTTFLNEMPFHPLIKKSPRDQRIIKGLKRVVRRLKKIYYASSSSATQVQVIGPPPPTFEQEKLAAMVKDKLAHQSTIKQKTLNIVEGIHLDTRHLSNTAIKNNSAPPPVVIIGNYPKKDSTLNLHRRRASSVSSTAPHSFTTTTTTTRDSSGAYASKEWSHIQKLTEYQERNMSDNSLESALSPGTSDYEEEEEDFLSDTEEEESNHSFSSSINNNNKEVHIASNELSEKLEQLVQQQKDHDERIRAEEFLATYSKNPALATATVLSQSHSTFSRPRSFYSAQLAIPSTVSTPDIYYPATQDTYFDTNDTNSNNNNLIITSTSYNSMAYPSVTDSEVVTPAGEHPRFSFNTFQIHHDNNASQRTTAILSDPRIKPLPPLVTTTATAKDTKQLPKYPTHHHDENEVWKLSINRKSESVLSENTSHTPRSRIVEIDIAHNHRNPNITIPPPLPPPVFIQEKRSIVLDYSTSLMAQQFCLIERAILLDINWEELVDCKWTKMSTSSLYQPPPSDPSSSDGEEDIVLQQGIYSRKKRMRQQEERNNDASERGVEKVITRFNAVCQWVSSEIVQTKSVEDRAKLIEKFIRLAKKCKLYCNFSTLIQILLGLQSSSVSRLDETWPLVKRREMKILQDLSNFTSPTKNWKHIRDSMTQVAEEYGESPTEIQVQVPQKNKNYPSSTVTIKLPFGGCIPFLGIYLSDLVFNAELPSYLPSPTTTTTTTSQLGNTLMNKVYSQPLVHFRKHRITATVIKRVLVFQNLAKRYSFEETTDPILHSACLHVASLDSDTIYKTSYDIEPVVQHH